MCWVRLVAITSFLNKPLWRTVQVHPISSWLGLIRRCLQQFDNCFVFFLVGVIFVFDRDNSVRSRLSSDIRRTDHDICTMREKGLNYSRIATGNGIVQGRHLVLIFQINIATLL